MHGNKHQMVLRHKGQILLNPLQSTLINITDVAVMPIDIVTVIKHDIMSLSTVKGIINRAEILFIGFIRMLVRTYSIFHIMISNHSIHRDIQHVRSFLYEEKSDKALPTISPQSSINKSYFEHLSTNSFTSLRYSE